ncbi:MAG: 3D-(3,5/4)-trihydroxycyclohexane-1,2-dione acylhydrolase (decyclizing) [Chloroflexota bacterium]
MSTTRRLTMAQALVAFLRAQHVERDGESSRFFAGVLGIFGHGNVAGIGEALEAEALGRGPDALRYLQGRNEQGMVHLAAAYAKQQRRLRTYACTTSIGPGATNMLTGAAMATVNRLPVLLLPGDIFATRRVTPVLQQLERPESQATSVNDAFAPLSRYWDRIDRPEQLVTALPAAMRVLTSPADTGAVTLCLPQDTQAEAWDYPTELFLERTWVVPRARPDRTLLARLADALVGARRPMIVAGGGVPYSGAEDLLAAFAARYGIPVTETQAGKGALAWDHPLNLGAVGATGGSAGNAVARDADLVLAIGTRLSDFPTASWTAWQDPDVRFGAINVAEMDAAKARAIPVVADARAALEELDALLAARGWTGVAPERRAHQEALRTAWNAEVDRVLRLATPRHVSQPEAIRLVNEAAGADGIVVCAAGSLPGDLHKLWRTPRPGGYHLEYGYSTMGYEVAGGVGVALAAPDRRVHVLVGDGSWLMLSAELATAVQEGVDLTVILLDNHGFRCIRNLSNACGGDGGFQDFRYRDPATGRLTGDVLPLDFVAGARSLGAHALTAHSPAELAARLVEARTLRGPVVIVTETDPSVGVPGYDSWWDVPVAQVSERAEVRAAYADYARHLPRERNLP